MWLTLFLAEGLRLGAPSAKSPAPAPSANEEPTAAGASLVNASVSTAVTVDTAVAVDAASGLMSAADLQAGKADQEAGIRLGAAFYINLDEFPGRRVEMERAYSSLGLRYQRFPGVRPTLHDCLHPNGKYHDLYEKFHPSRKSDLHDPQLQGKIRGEIGCIASHVTLLRHILATGRAGEVYMIAEDDYVPSLSFVQRLPEALRLLPSNWDALRLDCWQQKGETIHRMPQLDPGLFWTAPPTCGPQDGAPGGRPECHFCGGTHAVLVPFERAHRLLELWTGQYGSLFALDCMMARPDFNFYCLQWNLYRQVKHLQARSAIPKTRENVTQWHLTLHQHGKEVAGVSGELEEE